jgi:hypothetical protein
MLTAQLFQREAELCNGPGLEILHEHIGLCEHGRQQCLVVRLGEIEHHRFLAAVEPDEIARLPGGHIVVAAGEIAFRTLDFDYPRTGVGQTARAHGRGDRLLERHDENAFER